MKKIKQTFVTGLATIGAVLSLGMIGVNADTVTVNPGDTVSKIAQKYDTTVDSIQHLNNLSNPDLIFVGQQLKVNNDNNGQAAQQSTSQNTQAQASNNNYSSSVSGNDAAAKAWIAQHESSNNYDARNGQYIGKYQLSASYLNGDYSPANQERAADQYVAQRYGSWSNAQAHWEANGWY